MDIKLRFTFNLRLVAALSAAFLFLLLAFAMHYRGVLEQEEQHTGVLELMAATIPLLSLLLAAAFSRPAQAPGTRRQWRNPSR